MAIPEDQDDDDNKDKTNSDSFSTTTKNSTIKILIFVIILSIGIALSVLFFGTQLLFGGLVTPFFKVSSDSMIPTLQVNDTIIAKHIPFADLKIGYIIVFYSPYNSKVIVHRIIDHFRGLNNETVFETQGDANPFPIDGIDYPVREQNYIGKVVYHISTTDPLYNILRPPVIQIIILAAITIIVGSILYAISIKILEKKEKQD